METGIQLSRHQLAVRFLTEQTQYLARCSKVRSLAEVFRNGDPITLRELANENEGLTKVMLLNVIRKALVFHGAEGDVSDEAAMYLTEELIERYYYLSVAEISYVIRRNFTSKKYGKISASEILEWIRDYDSNDRVEYLNMHESHADYEEQVNVRKGHCITYDEYLADIKRKAEDGDEEAIKYFEDLEEREKKMISKNAIYQLYEQAKAEFFNKR